MVREDKHAGGSEERKQGPNKNKNNDQRNRDPAARCSVMRHAQVRTVSHSELGTNSDIATGDVRVRIRRRLADDAASPELSCARRRICTGVQTFEL